MISICVFLMTNEDEPHAKGSLVKGPFTYFPCLIGLDVLSLLNLQSDLYILDMRPLYLANVFTVHGVSFHFLNSITCKAEVFNCEEVQFIFLLTVCVHVCVCVFLSPSTPRAPISDHCSAGKFCPLFTKHIQLPLYLLSMKGTRVMTWNEY